MKKYIPVLLLFSILPFISGCGAIETVFKAGMWWAFFLIFIVVVVVLWLVLKAKK